MDFEKVFTGVSDFASGVVFFTGVGVFVFAGVVVGVLVFFGVGVFPFTGVTAGVVFRVSVPSSKRSGRASKLTFRLARHTNTHTLSALCLILASDVSADATLREPHQPSSCWFECVGMPGTVVPDPTGDPTVDTDAPSDDDRRRALEGVRCVGCWGV